MWSASGLSDGTFVVHSVYQGISNTLEIIFFTDDTNLFCCADNFEQLLDTVAHGLKKLKSLIPIKLSQQNLSKTIYIVFENRSINSHKKLLIHGIIIERLNETKFLGAIIDSKLPKVN